MFKYLLLGSISFSFLSRTISENWIIPPHQKVCVYQGSHGSSRTVNHNDVLLETDALLFLAANDDQIEKAKEIIKALTSNFDPMDIENPCKETASVFTSYRNYDRIYLYKYNRERENFFFSAQTSVLHVNVRLTL